MTTTFQDLINEVESDLHGMTADLEELTALTQDIGPDDTDFTVADATQVSRGLIEIDDELIWVTSVDQTNNIVHCLPFSRGYGASTAAEHTSGTMVMNNPRFPRAVVMAKINQALSDAYPEVFTVLSDESNFVNPVVRTYAVPTACDTILDISFQTIGPSLLWKPIRRYKFNPVADPTSFPTGQSVDIGDSMAPGRPIRITYISRPTPLVNLTDTLEDVGWDDNVRDVAIYGACWRLTASLEISRLQTGSIPQSDRASVVAVGSATNASKYYMQLYQDRLAGERARLLQLYPTTSHMVR